MKETFCSPGRLTHFCCKTEYVVRLFEIKLESLVLVVPRVDRVKETTVSWRGGCIDGSSSGESGPGGQEESLAQSTGLLDIWKGRCWERTGIVIEKLIGRKMERSSKHFFAFILDYFSLCFF